MLAPSPVGIIGVGEPGYRPQFDVPLPELVHRSARKALSDANVDREVVDNVVACASDLDDGRAISSMMTASPGGSYDKDFVKTPDTGVHAIELALLRMESGMFDSTLVLSWGKVTESDLPNTVHLEGDPFYHRNTGLGVLTGHAMQATAMAENDADAETAAAQLAEHDTGMGSQNPRVEGCEHVSADTVADSDVLSWPLREGHVPADADGATALLLATAEFIDEHNVSHDPVWIEGIGRQTATYNAGSRQFGELETLATAANRAYSEADLSDPRDTVDAVEIHGASTFHELMALDALELVDDDPISAVLDGEVTGGDELTVNPSGGTLAANPLLGAGLARVAAAARQVRGDGATGGSVSRAVAHATAGFTDQVHGVAVLGGDDSA